MSYLKRNKGGVYSTLSFISLYFILFDPAIPPIKIFGGAPFSLFISFLSLIFFGLSEYKKEIKNFFKSFFILYFIVTFYTLGRILYGGGEDTSLFRTSIRADISLIAVFTYSMAFLDENLFKKIRWVYILCAIFAIVAVSVPPMLSFSLFLKAGGGVMPSNYYNPYRLAFPSGVGYFGIAAIYALFFISLSVKIYIEKRITLLDLFSLVIIAIGGILAGRVMIPFIILGLGIIFVKKPIKLIIGLCLITIVAYFSLPYLNISPRIIEWILKVMPGHESSSLGALREMYHLPNSVNLIIGDGIFKTDTGYYQNVDVGYLRYLFFGGMLFLPLVYIMPFLIGRNIPFVVTFFFILVSFSLEAKGTVILFYSPYIVLYLLLIQYFKYFMKQMALKKPPQFERAAPEGSTEG